MAAQATSTALGTRDPSSYKMGRSFAASLRLSMQHNLLVGRQGWLLHPNIENDLHGKSDLQIADVAAGNGVWAFDAAQRYPHAEVVGLDVSTAQFPPDWCLLDNMKWRQYNLFDEVPDDLVGRFDVVHLRFLLAAIPEMSIDSLIDKLKTLLRPGGWLQYVELHASLNTVVNEELQPIDEEYSSFYQVYEESMRAFSAVAPVAQIEDLFHRHGFGDVDRFLPPFKKHLLKMDTDNVIIAITEFANATRSENNKTELVDEAVRKITSSAQNGTMFGLHFVVATGRKAKEKEKETANDQ